MNLSRIILKVTGWLKPVLLEIFPYQFLRRLKGKMIKNSYQKLSEIEIKPFERSRFTDGIHLIGNVKAETGLGQSCRLVAKELEHCSLPYSIYQYNQIGLMSNGDTSFDSKIRKDLLYNINVVHINPHELGLAFLQMDREVWNYRYNIGFWLWELEEFPDEYLPCFHLFDEIWTPSEFISRGLRKKTSLPVVTIPYHVSAEADRRYKRADFSLPEDLFLFLMMYDRTSMTERKNPDAVLEAYRRAFCGESDSDEKGRQAGLVIKINNCTEEELAALKSGLGKNARVFFITEVMSRAQVSGLIQCADAVVSLHRAEGFGLVLAEAMLLGTPVIATNWSSNTEFMTPEVSCLVEYELVELEEDIGLFQRGNRWAEPDVGQAAEYMRRLFEDREYAAELAKRAKRYVERQLGLGQAVEKIEGRIAAIYGGTGMPGGADRDGADIGNCGHEETRTGRNLDMEKRDYEKENRNH